MALFTVEEYNVLRAWVDGQKWEAPPSLPSLGRNLEGVPDCDLRVTIAWDADETDVDIHVTEPLGEEAYFAHRRTTSGGRVSEEITDGYGPELYEIRRARMGAYLIRAHYYASHQQSVFGPATCTLTVFSDWGRPSQTQSITSTRLDHAYEMTTVGSVTYGKDSASETSNQEAEDAKHMEPGAITLGMSPQEVVAILGPTFEVQEQQGVKHRTWTLENGHEIRVTFVRDKVRRVLERMP